VRLDELFQAFGVLLVPAPAFSQERRGVVTGMIVQNHSQVTVEVGSVRLEFERGAIGGDSVIEPA